MESTNVVSFANYLERKPALHLIQWPMSMVRHEILHAAMDKDKPWWERRVLLALVSDDPEVFAHVLNFPESEDIWPGDAAKLLYPELFACRLSNERLYIDASFIAEHFRCETQRLCSGGFYELSYFEYDFYHHSENRSFPDSLFGDDGDDEEDSMDSVLLLTQEYEPPKR